MGEPYGLQPLRIISGWTVEINNFCECDPNNNNCSNFSEYFFEDLLQLTNNKFNLLIDLGWYPNGDEKGAYALFLIKDYNWENPLEVYEGRDIKAVVDKIELWTNHGYYQKYISNG